MSSGKNYRWPSSVEKRSVLVAGHKTSISLEQEFWVCLRSIAYSKGMTIGALVQEIDEGRKRGNLSSHLRLYILAHYVKRFHARTVEVAQ